MDNYWDGLDILDILLDIVEILPTWLKIKIGCKEKTHGQLLGCVFFLTTFSNFKQGGQDVHNIQDIPSIPIVAHVSFSLQLFVILSKVGKISTISRISRPSQ